jgi:hypothetical protein
VARRERAWKDTMELAIRKSVVTEEFVDPAGTYFCLRQPGQVTARFCTESDAVAFAEAHGWTCRREP